MKCVICHSDNIISMSLNEEIMIDNNIYNIPIDVLTCKDCGERYYDRKTVRYLEETKNKIKQKKINFKETGKVLTIV
jgi:hypothetical protein